MKRFIMKRRKIVDEKRVKIFLLMIKERLKNLIILYNPYYEKCDRTASKSFD